MEKFSILVDMYNTAEQIAELINVNNKLKRVHTIQTILNSDIKYLVEYGSIGNMLKVIGCVGIKQINPSQAYIKHLSVNTQFRKLGIASKLIDAALQNCTGLVLMTIRSDNFPSLKLSENKGFVVFSIEPNNNYNIITVGKQK